MAVGLSLKIFPYQTTTTTTKKRARTQPELRIKKAIENEEEEKRA